MAEFLPKNEMGLVNAQIAKISHWFDLGHGITIPQMLTHSHVKTISHLDGVVNIVAAAKAAKAATVLSPWSKYLTCQKSRKGNPDIVYLSGQYRMAAALLVATETPTVKILFPDFLNNEYQKPVLQYLDIEARTGNLVVLKPKKDLNIAAAKKAVDDFSKDSR